MVFSNLIDSMEEIKAKQTALAIESSAMIHTDVSQVRGE